MNRWFKVLALVLCGLSVTACSTTISKVSDARGTLLDFTEVVGEHRTQLVYMVHADLVRVDYGQSGSYTLFDRRTKTIYDINEQEQSVVVIKGTQPILSEQALGVTIVESDSGLVGDGSSTHFIFKRGDEVCLNVVGLRDFLPAVEAAMDEMAAVRANDPRLADVDPQSCEYIIRIFANSQTAVLGMPVRQWSGSGYSKFLDTYQVQLDLTENTKWYKLPEWY